MAVWTKMIKEDRTMRNNTNTLKHLFAALLTFAALAAGHATAWAQVTISTAEEWNTFASNVNSGTTYSGQTIVLTADITVTTGVGSSSTNSFKGIFEGGGHTLTLNLTHSSGGDAWIAPFRYINGATIRHLHTAGTITTNGKMAGGIVGDSYGTSTIQSCRSSVAISSSISGDGTHGGLVGRVNNGTLTINDCLFDGSITGAGTNSCGGFVGWKEASLVLNRCLQAGDLSGIDSDGGATFSRYNSGSVNFTTCYYRTAYGTAQGTQTSATGSTLQGLLGSAWEVSGDDVFPIMDAKNLITATISGVEPRYTYTDSEIKPEPVVTTSDGMVLTKDTHYTVEWSGDGTSAGEYTLTVTGISPYIGSLSATYTVITIVTTSYVDAAGTEHTAEAIPLDNTMTTLSAGTYVVNSNVKYTSTVTIAGDVTLILADGYTMSIGDDDNPLLSERCMYSPYNLTIYGQSLGTGYLKMYSNSHDGIYISNDKNYTQHSGNVLIVHHSGSCIYNGNVILRGGTLDVESGGNAYGDIYAKTISILGGKLWARFKGLNGQHGITLGFTNSTDLIYAYKYNPNGFKFEIVSGQTLVDEYGCPYSGTLRYNGARYDFEKQTLRPVTGVTLTKNEYDYNDVSATFDGTSTTTVSIPVDVNVTSVTYNRTFTAGTPATVMLPFDYTCNGNEGGTFYTFAGVSGSSPIMEEGNHVTSLTANTPYIFMPTATTMSFPNIENMSGGVVTLNPTAGDHEVTSGSWKLVGSYAAKTWTANEVDNIFLLDGTLVPMETGAVTKPAEGYFQWTGSGNSGLDDITITATEATVLGESKYVTTYYNSGRHYRLPEGAKAYTASLDGAKVLFHQVGVDGNVIPRGTAVIVVGDAASITLTKLASTEVTAYAGNILQGSDTSIAKPSGTVYVLGVAGEPAALGFFSFSGSTIPAGKAYYVVE
ncbi:MAG: hypothetical protein IK045_01495 [Bacteroidales bacterium]|nr:hypothetical protein [Bacteroidales bacterium]